MMFAMTIPKAQIQKRLKNLEAYCAEKTLRLTDPRRHVFEIIASSDMPVSAYDVLEKLGRYIDNPKPPTAYRALEFLAEQGFVHRIESLNAYVVCDTDHRHAGSQFLVCDSCGKVIEAHLCNLPEDLAKKVKKEGFSLNRWNAEIHGSCSDCA